MSTLSLRETFGAELSHGLIGMQPYDTTNGNRALLACASVRALIPTMQAPPAPSPGYCDNPKGNTSSDQGWGGTIQGVTHDAESWFFSTTYQERDGFHAPASSSGLFKIPVASPIKGYVKQVAMPDRDEHGNPLLGPWRHFGDIDYSIQTMPDGSSKGCIFVPVEHDDLGAPGVPPRILVFDTELNLLCSAFLPLQTEGPWCAVNPVNGLLYSSEFNDELDAASLYVYKPRVQPGVALELQFVGKLRLYTAGAGGAVEAAQLRGIQGGAFSANGHLYLSLDGSKEVRMFNTITGRQALAFPIATDDEIEGMTVWPINADYCHHSGHYELHVLHNQTGAAAGTDPRIYFKHYFFDDLSVLSRI